MARGASVIVKTDVSHVQIVGETGVRHWTPPALPDDRPPSAREARARAAAAASWVSRDADARRKIDAIYADVDEALCVWMRAPSAARPVVASHLRTMAQEWGDEASVLSVEPSREETAAPVKGRRLLKKRAGDDEGEDAAEPESRHDSPGFSVVALPDAMIRLVADGIDGAGVRVGTIATVWHMLARVIGASDAPGVSAIVISDPSSPRLIWAWADASGLRAGGCVRLGGESIDDAARRLALDWLTWGAQLGCCPSRLAIHGQDTKAWTQAFGRAWQAVPTETDESADPIAECARRASEHALPARSGRWCLARVTRRPTRATRARHQLAGAALVLLLIAVSSVAFRLWQKTVQWKAEAAETRQQMVQAVRDTWPQKAATQPLGSPRKVAETLFAEEIRDFKPYEAPPNPRPIFAETMRIATILAAKIPDPLIGSPPVLLTRLVLDQERGNTLSFRVPDRQMGTELIEALKAPGRLVVWDRTGQSLDPTQPNLTGEWTKETE